MQRAIHLYLLVKYYVTSGVATFSIYNKHSARWKLAIQKIIFCTTLDCKSNYSWIRIWCFFLLDQLITVILLSWHPQTIFPRLRSLFPVVFVSRLLGCVLVKWNTRWKPIEDRISWLIFDFSCIFYLLFRIALLYRNQIMYGKEREWIDNMEVYFACSSSIL